MASDVTLSKAVRSNLLSLQNTADLLNRTQERLATGKRVNSALDNPTNFFTASALSARSGDLGRLLDSVSNGVQTLQAADKGISSITKLVESAQATARQAQQTAQGDVAYNLTSSGSVAVAADTAATTTGLVNLRDPATKYATAAGTGTTKITDATIADMAGQSITLNYGTKSVAITFGTGTGQVNTLAEFNTQLGAANTALGSATLEVNAGTGKLDFKGAAADKVNSFKITASDSSTLTTLGFAPTDASSPIVEIQADNLLKELNLKNGDTLTFRLGEAGATQTIVFGTGTGQINSRADLVTKLQGLSSLSAANTKLDGARVRIEAADANNKLYIGGSARSEVFGASVLPEGINNNIPENVIGQTNADFALLEGQQMSVQLGNGSITTVTFGSGANRVNSRAALLDKLNEASPDLKASFDAGGRLKLQSTSQYNLNVSGNGAAALGVQVKSYEPTATVNKNSAARESLQKDFNYTLSQINTLAKDASYNGVNLLTKDNLSVIFNENGSSRLDIEGVDFTAEGMGLTNAAGNDFQKNAKIDEIVGKLGEALSSLRTQASKFGSNLSIVQTRQDFTKNLINVLDTGAANLTLADTNAEAANALALQTRQQLSSTALSLSNQADQAVLRLF
jgi:flagellin